MTDDNESGGQYMSQWVIKGIRTGIKTTAYPRGAENAAGVTPGLPRGGGFGGGAAALVERCLTHALDRTDGEISVDNRRCVHCYRCVRGVADPLNWETTYEWAGAGVAARLTNELGQPFQRSIHVLVVDAGDCGACLNEVKQLNNPYYNMHRLGFFITPTPRHADVLLVVGPVTDQMRFALKKVYEAMPTPKRVVAVGACALSGGVFAKSFVCANGVADVLPVDVEVPGNPPPPLAILHGLLVAVGRKPPAALAPAGFAPAAAGR
jgi:Ni,Fe-hydrogenase III small subunit